MPVIQDMENHKNKTKNNYASALWWKNLYQFKIGEFRVPCSKQHSIGIDSINIYEDKRNRTEVALKIIECVSSL